ncbi:GTP cyclohydrolase I FolE [Lachnobacterium bovis]|uniref:GTP cyclohydrolase 1 n=1 Tax=Lachnobacterium bovis DSM 14045 TaxID=1122142 RepID=A0A1H3LS01_9FIRM|nr:GTP cyclohydrolase I FolE [Lachnobacterium bovis]SDY66869.1 GTP cyclohydrolase I [Lachnobacterium bovis DSM 14045]
MINQENQAIKKIDTEKIEKNIREILIALGANPDSEGLKETPKRVAKMYEEVFEGMNYTNDQIAEMFNKTFSEDIKTTSSKDMVIVKDIDAFSYCEHHMALMYNMKIDVAYIPNGKVIGLSKIARIVDMVTKRLQLQERIGTDILDIMKKITESQDIAVIIRANHSCMTARGIKNINSRTYTQTLSGKFEEDTTLLNRLTYA